MPTGDFTSCHKQLACSLTEHLKKELDGRNYDLQQDSTILHLKIQY